MTAILAATSCLRTADGRRLPLDVGRWLAPADEVDQCLLDRAVAPVLDVGCGPGRHVRALAGRGMRALGVELSPAAVAVARRSGARVLQASVFDALPGHGRWRSALLLDGSIGIGGDPELLLGRVAELLAPRARVLVETDPPASRSEALTVCIETPHRTSDWFRWAVVSHGDVADLARSAGFSLTEAWRDGDRFFARLDHRPGRRGAGRRRYERVGGGSVRRT